MARVFISHANDNRDQAERLQRELSQRGQHDIFLDTENLRVGQDWERRLYDEINQCHALLIVLSRAWLKSQWCFAEYTQARSFGKPVLPLICEDLPQQDLDRFAPQIQRLVLWQNRDQALEQLLSVLADITLNSGGGAWPPADDPQRIPFPGLQAFQEQDAPVFYGREQEIRSVLEHLQARRVQWGQCLLLLHGAAGVGKSSLLRAGVIPRLKRLPQQWIVVPPLRPHPDACAALGLSLAIALRSEGIAAETEDVLARFHQAQDAASRAAIWRDLAMQLRQGRGAGEARILIPIDQGEELLAQDQPGLDAFWSWLGAALESDQPIQVVMVLHSDSQGALREASGLGARMASYLVPRLSLQQLRDLIVRPARTAGLDVDPDLIDQARQDTATDQALPLLGCVLRELCSADPDSHRLTRTAYEALGNRAAGESPLDRVVSRKAEECLSPLPSQTDPASQAQLFGLRRALLRLVRFDGERLIRSPALLSDLPASARPLLERLAEVHLICIDGTTQRVEMTHDALLHHWPRLRQWLLENQDLLRTEALLAADLRLWQEATPEQQPAALLRGVRLEKAREWLRQHLADLASEDSLADPPTALRAFVESSDLRDRERIRREQHRRLWVMASGWSLAVMGALGVTGISWLWRIAERAVAGSYVSLHQAQVESDPLQSVIHGLAALGRTNDLRSGVSLQLAVSLMQALRAPLAVTAPIRAHQRGITSLALLTPQEWISGGADGRVRHWRMGRALSAAHSGAAGGVNALLVLPNGDWLSASDDGSLVRWRDGQPVQRLQRPDNRAGAVVSLLALPSGDWVSGSVNGELVLWREDRPVRVLQEAQASAPGANPILWSLAASPGGAAGTGFWLSGDGQGLLQRWSQDGQRLGPPLQSQQGELFAVLIRRDGSLVSGGSDGTIRFWSPDGQPRQRLRSRQGASVWGLVELANGELLSTDANGFVDRWRENGPVGKPLQSGHRGQWRLAIDAAGRTVVSFGETAADDRFQAWRLLPGVDTAVERPGGSLWSVAPDGEGGVLSGWRDGGLRLGLAGPLRGDLRGEGIWQLERLSNGDLLSLGSEGGLRRWSQALLSGQSSDPAAWGEPIEHGAGTLLSLRQHRGGWLLGDLRGRLWYWPQGRPSDRPLYSGRAPLFSLLSLPDGWLSGWGDGQLRRFTHGRLQSLDSGQPQVLSLALLPDGEWLSGGSDGSLQRWRDGQRAGAPFASGQSAVWTLLPLAEGDLLSVGEEGLHSTVRLISPRWVASLACGALAEHPLLQRPWGAAAEAAAFCRHLSRDHGGSAPPPLAPLSPLLRTEKTPSPVTIRLQDGRQLQWEPKPLTRLSAASLRASFLLEGQPRQADLNCRMGYWQTLPQGASGRPDSPAMRQLFQAICSRLPALPENGNSRGRGEGWLFDPPTRVRQKANGAVLCLLRQPRELLIMGEAGDWLQTEACTSDDGRPGVIHRRQLRF